MFNYNDAYGVNDYANNDGYFKMYWALFDIPEFKTGLSLTAKVLYGYVKNNLQMSMDPKNKNREKYIDENGKFFCYADQNKVAERLGLGKSTIKRAFNELRKVGLIGVKRDKIGAANRYYLLKFSGFILNLTGVKMNSAKVQNEPCARGQNEPLTRTTTELEEYQLEEEQQQEAVANAPSVSVVSKDSEKDLSTDTDMDTNTEMKKEDGCQPRTPSQDPVLKKLRAVGVSQAKAKTLLNKYGVERVNRNLLYVEAYPHAGNPAGLLIRALENDWGADTTATANERMTSYDSPATSYEPSDFAANLAQHEEEARARGRALLAKLCGGTH